MSVLKNFQRNLKELANKDSGFPARIAGFLGKSRSQIYNYMNGETVPGLDIADEVARAAGTSLAKMIGDDAPEYAAPAPTEITTEMLTMEMLRRFGVDKKRLEVVRFALEAKQASIETLLRQLPALEGTRSAGKGAKGAAGA
jgi:transcriptional regulator with XRE-family HTH domain